MLNKVQQLFIGNATGAANTNTVAHITTDYASIALGDIFFVNDTLKVLTASSDVTPTIRVVNGIAAGKFKISEPIRIGDITAANIQAYQAQAQKSIAIGNIGSATADITLSNGYTYDLILVINDDQRFMPMRQTRRTYSFTANFAASTPTFAEKSAFIQQFVDAINQDPYVGTLVTAVLNTASSTYVGIQITGVAIPFNRYNNRPEYMDFTASFYDATDATSTYQATSSITQAYQAGNGLASQVQALEMSLWPYEGQTNKRDFPVIDLPILTSATTNYDMFSIDWNADTPGILEGRDKKPKGLVIAVATGSTQKGQIETFLGYLNNSAAGQISNNVAFTTSQI